MWRRSRTSSVTTACAKSICNLQLASPAGRKQTRLRFNEARESNADSMSQDQLNEPDRLVRTLLSEFNCIDIIAVSLVASSPPSARCGAGSDQLLCEFDALC
jgi:hypothetical protein